MKRKATEQERAARFAPTGDELVVTPAEHDDEEEERAQEDAGRKKGRGGGEPET